MRLKSILVLLTLGCVVSSGTALAEAGSKSKRSAARASAARKARRAAKQDEGSSNVSTANQSSPEADSAVEPGD